MADRNGAGPETLLFTPLRLGSLELRNRIAMSPMCQYSARDGIPSDWHFAHYGARAALGLGLVVVEATAVDPRGRITPHDLGLWDEMQVPRLARIADFIRSQGAAAAIQLGHAGRKAGIARPWEGGKQLPRAAGGWERVAPSPLPYGEGEEAPRPLDVADVGALVEAWAEAAVRADAAGFDAVEIHAAHGYLLHQFLSPLSNRRTDGYGGSLPNRARFLLEVLAAVRQAWPAAKPVMVRISATDWAAGGWDLPEAVELARLLKAGGADLVDVSSGGLTPLQRLDAKPGFQVPFSRAIREGAGIATGAVGLITKPAEAEAILREGDADLVLLGRELLRNPGWPWQARAALGEGPVDGRAAAEDRAAGVPPQYLRAR